MARTFTGGLSRESFGQFAEHGLARSLLWLGTMPKLVVEGAVLSCSMGATPASLAIASDAVEAGASNAANIDAFRPSANIPAFGMCQSTSNPQVQAATAAAQGVLTPQPCVPVTGNSWSPGSASVTVGGRPALHDQCTCACQWSGMISVTSAGQEDVDVD
jgi:hypothetical protein